MSKHTPGPWVASPYDGIGPMTTVRQGCAKTGMRIASTFQTTSPENIQRNEANARLIAAAPDLLEALRSTRLALLMMLSYHGQGSADYADAAQHRAGEAIDEASAAIAKATGEDA